MKTIMSCYIGEDIPVGIYRSFDNIKNLRIRIRIQKKVAASVSLYDSARKPTANELELLQLSGSKKSPVSEYTFSWQEKVSKEDETSVNTDEDPIDRIWLFSYVNSEVSALEGQGKHWLDISPANERKQVTSVPRSIFRSFQKPFFLDSKELVQTSQRKRPSHHAGLSMVIVAKIESHSNTDGDELRLCLVTYYPDGLLTVIPDFSQTPYIIQSHSSESYEYILDHASNVIKRCEAEQEQRYIHQIYQHHSRSVKNLVGIEFSMPRRNEVLWYLNGEMVSAINFDADNIFIRYRLQLQEGLKPEHEEELSGSTNTCKAKMNNGRKEAYFCLPFTCPIRMETACLKEDSVPAVSFLAEVFSIDYWSVCRNEGNGFAAVTLSPGYTKTEIKTWKLLPQTILGKLENYFLGGTPYLKDSEYIKMPSSHTDAQLSKYGIKTESSGEIIVAFHIAMHKSR